MNKQHPLPDYLKIPWRMTPEMRRQFRKFLKLIRKLEKKKAAEQR